MAGRYGPTANPRITLLLGSFAARLAQAAAPVMTGFLALAASALIWRRLAGALCAPLTTGGMFASGATLAALGALLRLARRVGGRSGDRLGGQSANAGILLDCGISGLLVVIGTTISLPGTPPGALLLLWAPMLLEECAWWTNALVALRTRRIRRSLWPSGLSKGDRAMAGAAPCSTGAPAVSEQTVQHIVRTRSADGKEKLIGWLRLDFAPGQRAAVAHVAFCLPLDGSPTLTVRQRFGPDCRMKTTQVLPYGARVELRLVREAAQAQQVVLEFEAHN